MVIAICVAYLAASVVLAWALQSVEIAMLLVCFAAAVEELIFRVALPGYFAGKLPVWAALMLSSALFAVSHRALSASELVTLFMAGLMLCWIYEYSGSFASIVAFHAAHNISRSTIPLLRWNPMSIFGELTPEDIRALVLAGEFAFGVLVGAALWLDRLIRSRA